MRAMLAIGILLASLFPATGQPKQFDLLGGATDAGDGFYMHITAESGKSIEDRPKEWPSSTIRFRFKIPHTLGADTAGRCVVQLRDWRGQDLLTLDVTPYPADETRKEDAFDIILIRKLAEETHLHIQYDGKAEWGGQIITRVYNARLKDYFSLVK